jgi:membrane fusion protein, multidrug efflux system
MNKRLIICTLSIYTFFISCKEGVEELSVVQNGPSFTWVETMTLAKSNEAIPINAIGRLASDTEVKLSFKIGGIISQMMADEGDFVQKGKTLATMRTNEIDAQVLKAERALQKAQRDLDRVTKMYADSAVTLEAVQDLTTLVQVNGADVEIAKFNQLYARIVSPISGRILKRLTEPNELVSPGQPIFIIASSDGGTYIMKASLSDKDINEVNYNDAVSIQFDAYPNTVFKGKILQIDESSDPRTGTFGIEISIDTQNKRLRNGYIGRINILPKSDVTYVKIPMDAIVESVDDKLILFSPMSNDTIAKEWAITPYKLTGDYVLISEKELQFDRVITTGGPYLVDGDIIRIKR